MAWESHNFTIYKIVSLSRLREVFHEGQKYSFTKKAESDLRQCVEI